MIDLEEIQQYRKDYFRKKRGNESARKSRLKRPYILSEEQKEASRIRAREYKGAPNYKSIERLMLTRTKARAKRLGIEHTITIQDIVIPEYCPVLGIKLEVGRKKKRGPLDNSPSLDRIDNTKGYIPGNIIVVSFRTNRLKGDASINEMQKIIDFYKNLKCE